MRTKCDGGTHIAVLDRAEGCLDLLVVTFVLTFGDLRHVLTACVPSRVMRKPTEKRKILHNAAGSGRMRILKPAGIGNWFVYSPL